MEVFCRFFLYWASDKPHCKFGDNPCKALQRSGRNPIPGVQDGRWLAVFFRYKRQHWPFHSNISHCCSYAPVVLSSPLVLIPGPSFCLQLLKTWSHLPAFAWLFLTTFILVPFCSARTLVPTLSTWFPLLASPALQRPCSRAWSSSCVMVQESATDQTPSPPGNLRQIVTCLIFGPTAPFILVFSTGYNHELDSPGKQYLHTCCSLIWGTSRQRSLPVFLWGQKYQTMIIRLHKLEYLPSLTSCFRRADQRLSQGIKRDRRRWLIATTW